MWSDAHPVHGGADAQGRARFDFSSNANACGPCPSAFQAVLQANPCDYPDPSYTALREQLAGWHQVATERVLLAASASEFIFRFVHWAALRGIARAVVPQHSYGDYARAARASGLSVGNTPSTTSAAIRFVCEPSNPLGQCETLAGVVSGLSQPVLLDRAYEPLRLQGQFSGPTDHVWQLWTPNKALGLTGLRAAYALAPVDAQQDAQQLQALCPSWPVGSHGVAALMAWTQPDTQDWLAQSLGTLRHWKALQLQRCEQLGWQCLPSQTNFFVARLPQPLNHLQVQALRDHGIKLRDTDSFGLPQHVRLSVQPPDAQQALVSAFKQLR